MTVRGCGYHDTGRWHPVETEPDRVRRARAVDALARGQSVSAAARASGYSRVHLQRLRKTADFTAEVEAARAALESAPAGAGPPAPAPSRLAQLEDRGLELLADVVAGKVKDAGPTHRVQAAKALIAHAAGERARLRGVVPQGEATVTGPPAAAPPSSPSPPGPPTLKVLDPLSPEAQVDASSWLDAQA